MVARTLTTVYEKMLELNPFRYRGYVWDREVELYALESRNYDVKTGRFLIPDDTSVLEMAHDNMTQYNLYAYCFNSPSNLHDTEGYWPNWLKKAVAAVAVVAVVAVAAVVTVATTGAGTAAAVVL